MRDWTDARSASSMGPFLESKYSSRLKVDDVEDEEVVDDEATCSVVVVVVFDVGGTTVTSLAGVNAETRCKEEEEENADIAAQRAAALMMREERVIVAAGRLWGEVEGSIGEEAVGGRQSRRQAAILNSFLCGRNGAMVVMDRRRSWCTAPE